MSYLVAALVAAFAIAASLALTTSAWVPPNFSLGRMFWILTVFLIAAPAIALATFLVFAPADTTGYGVIGIFLFLMITIPIAAGWLLGVVITLLVSCVRATSGKVA